MEINDPFLPFPALATPRLLLRALRADDLDDLHAYSSDPEIDRFTPWEHSRSLGASRADLEGYLATYARGEMGVWGIKERESGRLIGICNFTYWHRNNRRAEIGYTVARRCWGRGYATEAAAALVEFGVEQMGLARVEAVCLPENIASMRVLEKIGMHYEGLLRNYQVWRGVPRDLAMYACTAEAARSGSAV